MKSGDDKPAPPATKSDEGKTANGGATDALQKRVQALEEERDRLKAELSDVRDKHLRSRADFDNLVKRVSKETRESVQAAKGALLVRVVALAETLERAERELEASHPADAKGMRLVLEDLRKLLRDEGVKEIESLGHAFNFRYHQAVERVETDQKPEGTILEVVQRGYLLAADVLRPALVKVAVPPRKNAGKEESVQNA